MRLCSGEVNVICWAVSYHSFSLSETFVGEDCENNKGEVNTIALYMLLRKLRDQCLTLLINNLVFRSCADMTLKWMVESFWARLTALRKLTCVGGLYLLILTFKTNMIQMSMMQYGITIHYWLCIMRDFIN